MAKWHDLGASEAFTKQPVTEAHVQGQAYAISYVNGQFGAISGVCNHVGEACSAARAQVAVRTRASTLRP